MQLPSANVPDLSGDNVSSLPYLPCAEGMPDDGGSMDAHHSAHLDAEGSDYGSSQAVDQGTEAHDCCSEAHADRGAEAYD